MGYRGKTTEQNQARDLRAQGWTYNEICEELGVSKGSVSLWCHDVPVDEAAWEARRRSRQLERRWVRRGPNALARRRTAEIERLRVEAAEWLGRLSEREFLAAGIALYAGEGAKTDGGVRFANSDPRMILFFVSWLRHFFDVDESRLRVRLYLHQGLDIASAIQFWSDLTAIPAAQFTKTHRAVPDPSIRRSRHPMGCPSVCYSCSPTHRSIMGLVTALLASELPSGVAQ